jgi:hypothetical protein
MQMQVDYPSIFDTAIPKVYIRKVSLLPSVQTGVGKGISYDPEAQDGLETNKYGTKSAKPTRLRLADAGQNGKALEIKVEVAIKERIKQNGDTTWYNNKEFNNFLKLKIVLAKNRQAIEDLEEGRFTPRFLKRLKKRNSVVEKIITLRKNNTPILNQKVEIIDGKQVYCTTYEVTFKILNFRPRNISVFAATFVDLREYYQYKSPSVKSSKRFLQGTTVSQRVIKAGDVITDANIYLLPNNKVWAGPVHYHEPTGFMAGAFHSSRPHSVLERKKVPNLVVQDFRIFETISKADFLLRPERKTRQKNLKIKPAQGIKIIKKSVYITEPSYAFDQTNQLRFVFHVDMHKLIAEKSQFGACFRQADARAKKDIMTNTKIKNLVVLRHRVEEGLSKNDVIKVDGADRDEVIAQSGEGNRNRLKPRRTQRPLNPQLVDSENILVGGVREIKLDMESATGIRTFTVSDLSMSEKTDGLYSYSVDFEIQDGTATFINNQRKKLVQAIGALTEYYNVAKRPENVNTTTGLFTDDFVKEMEQQYRIPDFNEVNIPNRRRRRKAVQSSIAKAPWLNAIAVYTDVIKNLTNVATNDIVRAGLLLHSLVEPASGTVQGIETLLSMLATTQSKISPAVIGGKNRSGAALADTSTKPVTTVDYKAKTAAFKTRVPKTSIRLVKQFKTIHNSNIQNFVGYDFLNLRRSKNLGLRVLTTEQMAQRLSLENQKYFSRNVTDEIPEAPPAGSDSQTPEDFTRFINLEDAYYSYLTPARILYGKKRLKLINRGRRLWNTKQYDSIISAINNATRQMNTLSNKSGASFRLPRTFNFMPTEPVIQYGSDYNPEKAKISLEAYETNAVNSVLLNKYGVSLTTRKTEKAFVRSENKLNGIDAEETDIKSAQKFLGKNSSFVSGTFGILEQAAEKARDTQLRDFSAISNIFIKSSIISKKGTLSKKANESVKVFRPADENNIIDQYLEKYDDMENSLNKKQKFISKIPNQIKSIFLGDDPRVNKNWFTFLEEKGLDVAASSRYTGLYYFNYNHVNQIEVLVGFKEDRNGNAQASSPIYRLMTKEIFDRISNSNRPFVCRMRTAKVPYFGKSRKLNLPEYNETFILVSRTNREDLNADAEIVETQEEATEDFDFETAEESIFVSRLTEYEDLSTTGRRMLRRLIRRNTRLGGLMPEFASTTYVQQPERISRTGATFGIDTEQKQGQSASGVANEAVATATRARSARTQPNQSQAPTTTARSSNTMTTTPTAPTSTPSGGSGGGY